MKSLIYIIMLILSVNCFAQVGKDSTSKTNLKQKESKGNGIEKPELIPPNTVEIMQSLNLYRIRSEVNYSQDFKKPLLKNILEQNLKPDKDIINENMQGILADVRRANEDKRSPLLKTVESALGIAQAAVVAALAVREVVREIEYKPKK
jgi:hypothetical protein